MLRYYWRNVVPVEGVVGFFGDISNMAERSWCRSMGHRMPKNKRKNLGPSLAVVLGMLWATRELLASFCWTTTAHPTQRNWLRLDWFQSCRQVCWVHGWLGSHGVQSRLRHIWLNKCDQNASLAYQGQWAFNVWSHLKPQLKWNITAIGIRHHSLPAGGVASHGPLLALVKCALCEA